MELKVKSVKKLVKKIIKFPQYKIVYGAIISPVSDTKANIFPDGALLLRLNEKTQTEYIIEAAGEKSFVQKKLKALIKSIEKSNNKITTIEQIDFGRKIIIPSFFDVHFHWVQDEVSLMPKDSLLDWLSNYTWPYENKFEDKQFTSRKAEEFSKKLISVGTLGGAIYGSIHSHTVDAALEKFVGEFIVGNVLMTMNSPDYLTQTSKDAQVLISKLSKKYASKYAITPRFAPTTDPATMKKAAKLSRKYQSFIQTHLSENLREIEWVLDIYRNQFKDFKDVSSYVDIYKKANILTDKTIMAHAIYLSDEELKVLKKTKTKIAHCPTSNAPVKDLGLGSGLFDFKRIEKYKIDWALASDIGGGPYLSMLDVINSFVEQNRKKKIKEATYVKGLYRSTVAGAKLLKIGDRVGQLKKGYDANFLVLDFSVKKIGQGVSNCDVEKLLEKMIRRPHSKRNEYMKIVEKVFYRGQQLH